MNHPDLLDAIRGAFSAADPALLTQIEPVLTQMRQLYGGDTVYIRAPERIKITRRTLQNHQRKLNART
ncbi:MAG TPA: hypothetical protein PK959_06665 [Candidatus Competibacteraceae bacterium]|nr:hypothetical protein [Candidatus Competibacteraceae bacterium]